MSHESEISPSGVRIARDFRSNLIIDRYDPVFADMRASKIKHLRSVRPHKDQCRSPISPDAS